MVDILAAIAALLRLQTPITDLVGSRIYTDQMPQGAAVPNIVFWTVNERVFTSTDMAHIGLSQASIQVDCSGNSRGEANNVAWQVSTALNAFAGDVNGVRIKGIVPETGLFSLTDPPSAGTDQYRFGTSQTLSVTYDFDTNYGA